MSSMEIVAFDAAQRQVIREQIAPEITDPELVHFEQVCMHTGLSPFTSPPQIYAVMRNDRRLGRKKLVIQTGIDGMRLAAARSNAYAGSDEAVYQYADDGKAIVKATVTVYRMVGGVRCPFEGTARWAEFCPPSQYGQDAMWVKMPHVQIGKCAEAQALRKAFPVELGGVYSSEEMAQAGADGEPVDAVEKLSEQQRVDAIEKCVEAGFGRPAAVRRVATVTPAEYETFMARLQQTIDETAEAAVIDVEATEEAGDTEGEHDAA